MRLPVTQASYEAKVPSDFTTKSGTVESVLGTETPDLAWARRKDHFATVGLDAGIAYTF